MTNAEIIFQLRERLQKLRELEKVQETHMAAELVKAERNYVEALLDYREKHGGLEGIKLL
jgi:hypothetical protein